MTTANRYGIDSMFYTGNSPWQGVGTPLDGAATAEEAIVAAGLDWEVGLRRAFIESPSSTELNPQFFEDTSHKALTRLDTGKVFNYFSDRYEPFQNRDAFTFLDPVKGSSVYHSAGSLKGGSIVFLYSMYPEPLVLPGGETIEMGILLTTTHDGSGSVNARFLDNRTRCCNTLPGVLRMGRGQAHEFKAMHTKSLEAKIEEARRFMGLEGAHRKALELTVNSLANTHITAEEREVFLIHLFGQQENPEAVGTRIRNQMDEVDRLFSQGIGNEGWSRWDMLNGVTEFTTHHKSVRGGESEKANRLHANWFGTGRRLNDSAMKLLMEGIEGKLAPVAV